MQAVEIGDIVSGRAAAGRPYLEFLRESSMSLGLYVLPAGGVDNQQPHTEDEVYYVLSGQGAIQVNDESRPVQPGTIIFVKAGEVHRFHSITEGLSLLVFFAPAEYSQGSNPAN